jgi:hypothetical protein
VVTLGYLLGIYDRRGKQPFPVDLPKLMALGERSGSLTSIATTEKRFVVRADEKLTASLELEIATSGQRDGFLVKGVFRACSWIRLKSYLRLSEMLINSCLITSSDVSTHLRQG